MPNRALKLRVALRAALPGMRRWLGCQCAAVVLGVRGCSRLSRGRCVACAYDLHASRPARCPECGGPILIATGVSIHAAHR